MKPVIIGARGQLGRALVHRLPEAVAVDRDELDITSAEALEAFDWSKCDTIINAAAYTNVDGAETPDGRIAAWQINAQAPARLAAIAARHNLTLIHISSDYVFDGRQSPHTELEPFSPLGVYAQSKAAGDLAVGTAPKHYIVRVSWLIGDGPNFVRAIANLAERNISPSVVDDQVGRLTFTSQLVEAVMHLATKQSPYGTYNLSGGGDSVSLAEISKTIFNFLGRKDLTITPVSTEQYYSGKDGISPRPRQSAFDLAKIKSTGFEPRNWRDDLVDYIAELTKKA